MNVVTLFNEEYYDPEVMATISYRYPIKNPPFYVTMKIMDKIAHHCLAYEVSGPNVMSNIIMEQPG
jgi:hypothetical protein